MKLCCSRFGLDPGDIMLAHPTAGHDDDASVGLLDEIAEEWDALHGRGLLAGGEHTVDAVTDEALEGVMWVAADVEGAVEGDGEGAGGGYEAV